MASWQTPVTHTTGDTFSVSDYNVLASNEVFLYQRPYATFYNSIATTLTNSATQVTLGGTAAAGYGFSVSGNNVIFPITGTYLVSAQLALSSSGGDSSTILQAQLQHNGSAIVLAFIIGQQFTLPVTMQIIPATSGDTLGLYGSSSEGSPLTASGPFNTFVTAIYVGQQ